MDNKPENPHKPYKVSYSYYGPGSGYTPKVLLQDHILYNSGEDLQCYIQEQVENICRNETIEEWKTSNIVDLSDYLDYKLKNEVEKGTDADNDIVLQKQNGKVMLKVSNEMYAEKVEIEAMLTLEVKKRVREDGSISSLKTLKATIPYQDRNKGSRFQEVVKGFIELEEDIQNNLLQAEFESTMAWELSPSIEVDREWYTMEEWNELMETKEMKIERVLKYGSMEDQIDMLIRQ